MNAELTCRAHSLVADVALMSADAVLLVRRLIGPMRERDGGMEQQAGDDGGERCGAHGAVSLSGQAVRRSRRRASSDIEYVHRK